MAKYRRKIKWSRVIALTACLMIFVSLAAMAGKYFYTSLVKPPAVGDKQDYNARSNNTKDHINLLVLGVDDGDVGGTGTAKRSDTIMVVNINKKTSTVRVLSIPRDTRVEIPGHAGYEKIAHAYFYGGVSLAARTVENLLNIKIDHYLIVDWQGFVAIIDKLGGVDMYVEHDMHYEDPYAGLKIDLTKGYQHLDGCKAGQYVRFRSDELGDIGRVQRQQRFVKTLISQNCHVSNMFKIPFLLHDIGNYVNTDLDIYAVFTIVNSLKGFNSGLLAIEMLPGKFATIKGLSYWVVNDEQARQLVDQIFGTSTARADTLFGS